MNEYRVRLKALRIEMLKRNLDGYFITGTDPHASEYLPARWQTRSFISGFTGSYGIVVVTQEEAGLWTDTRYFLQAEDQLKGSGIKMYKLRVPGAELPENWLARKLPAGSKVGIDSQTISVSAYRKMEKILSEQGIQLLKIPDLFNKLWEDRPEIPDNPIFELDVKYTGLSRKEKREIVANELRKYGADYHVITTLDELAWMFNLRGSDVPYNPVFTGFGLVGRNESFLFLHLQKLPAELRIKLEKERIIIVDYSEFGSWLLESKGKTFFIDPESASHGVADALSNGNSLVEGPSVVATLKARKNNVELSGFRNAMKKDGVAMVEFLFWMKNMVGKEHMTEYTVGRKLAEFRSAQKGFAGESFAPIVGYKNHGAIVHLSVGPDDALPVKPEGILLFDSGGQYFEGTTDITRTIALGEVDERIKTDFTLVLKGMISLTLAVFPVGTKGYHLDMLARKPLCENSLNYGHGTGHGIGHFLNVHEGPMAIRQEYNPHDIEPGMVLSNEPALYREGEYGLRTENMMVCVEKEENEFGKFFGFETLTLCPLDTSLVRKELLDRKEIDWINEYHRNVNASLKPLLKKELHHFLDELTCPV